jgi:hypothetical protein
MKKTRLNSFIFFVLALLGFAQVEEIKGQKKNLTRLKPLLGKYEEAMNKNPFDCETAKTTRNEIVLMEKVGFRYARSAVSKGGRDDVAVGR